MRRNIEMARMTEMKIVDNSVADPDPGSVAFLTPGSGISDPKPILLRV
jgi:hypothetical protein